MAFFPFNIFSIREYIQHRHDCKRKQAERASRIVSLPISYHASITPKDHTILAEPIELLVHNVNQRVTKPIDILRTYSKLAISAHQKTNCLTEIMIEEAEEWLSKQNIDSDLPLAGIPVSLKDTIAVGGFDTSVGYSCKTGKPYARDGGLVRLLRDAGAVPYVKTNIPTSLLSFECCNDVWGRTTNPYNPSFSPGGSSGGEAALLVLGGSRIGIGSDVAGSVRVPAHFSGCYALRCSTGRWPKAGIDSSTLGQEGVPSVFSPMARTLSDLVYFTRSVIQMQPWKYDHSVHQVEWREQIERDIRERKSLCFGVMWTDGVIDPSPACTRALDIVCTALAEDGHTIRSINPPSPYKGLVLASQLLTSDGCHTISSFLRPGEHNDPGAAQLRFYMHLPKPIKYIYYLWIKYIRRDKCWAGLLRNFHRKSSAELWQLVAQRESYRASWHDWWEGFEGARDVEAKELWSDQEQEKKPDVFLTVPHAMPALPHGAMKDAVSSCGYTFLFNMLDYPSGVLPVTHVDHDLDQLPKDFSYRSLNGVARGAYKYYDAAKMNGLPVGVQVVGQRLQEEKVLAVMERIEECLRRRGQTYELPNMES